VCTASDRRNAGAEIVEMLKWHRLLLCVCQAVVTFASRRSNPANLLFEKVTNEEKVCDVVAAQECMRSLGSSSAVQLITNALGFDTRSHRHFDHHFSSTDATA